MAALTSALLLLTLPAARAAHWHFHVTGTGSAAVTGKSPVTWTAPGDSDYNVNAAPASSNNGGSSNPITATDNVSLTVVATWVADATDPTPVPPPAGVVLQETSAASASGGNQANQTFLGSVNDGCGDSGTSPVSTPSGGAYSYVPLQNGASTFTIKRTLSATVTAQPNQAGFSGPPNYQYIPAICGAGASVGAYTLNVSNVTINLVGTTPDASGNANILVGQGCKASLSVPSGLNVNSQSYQWSVSGTKFQQWSSTTPALLNANPPTQANSQASYEVDGPGPLTNPTAHWYWNDPSSATEQVTCTVTATPSSGHGSAVTVTATQNVAVQLPGWNATGTGGYMRVNTGAPGQNGAYALYAGPNAGQAGGINWSANVMSSALFTSGTLELVQTVIPNASYVFNTGVGVPGSTHYDPENGKNGLDSLYPYGWASYGSYAPPANPVPYTAYDIPSLGLSNATSATMQHQFTDTLMYMPPGGDSQWVPLGTFGWSTNGSASIPNSGNWATYPTQNGTDSAGTVNLTAGIKFAPSNTFPSWARINVFPTF